MSGSNGVATIGLARLGEARRGHPRQGTAAKASCVFASRGSVSRGSRGLSRPVSACTGSARRSTAAMDRRRSAWLGSRRFAMAGLGTAATHGHGTSALGPVGLVWVHHGVAAVACLDITSHATAGFDAAALVRHSRVSRAEAAHGTAVAVRLGMSCSDSARSGKTRQQRRATARLVSPGRGAASHGSSGTSRPADLTLGVASYARRNIDHPRGSAAGGASGRRMSHGKGNPS